MLDSYSLQHLGFATRNSRFGVPAGGSGDCVAAMMGDQVRGVALVHPVSIASHGRTSDVGGVNQVDSWMSPSPEDLKGALIFAGHNLVLGRLDPIGPRFIPNKPPRTPSDGVVL